MNATANPSRQRRQVALLIVLFTVLVVVVGIEIMPLLEGSDAPPPAPVAARPAPPPPAKGIAPRPPARSSGGRPTRPGTTQAARQPTGVRPNGAKGALPGVEDVHLAQLQQPEPEPIDGHRNPFTFGTEPRPAAAAGFAAAKPGPAVAPVAPPPAVAMGPPPVPPPPPITLKFFGIVTAPGRVGKVAALGDGKYVYHGQEGSIVEGRYRIVKIGEESIQMEYVDGRGRQTIRLSGK
jgi:hypothetical protein